ncbi:hypothetical protein VXS02_02610 [Photobacterium piscicola]|uniref:hypothetical protein n=1 Tax=Photobacterium piscicola TaxID=1378299 RepID=UPI002E193FF3|nr:hypothetical protein [Photobacterium piscicola]MEC6881231.1 hypothetical protein [Photobacterium piscicola]
MIKYGALYLLFAIVFVGAILVVDRIHNDHLLTQTKDSLHLDNDKERAEFASEIVHKYILEPDQSLPVTEGDLFPYLYGYADLNNNGRDEVFILMQTEEYCTEKGCQGFLFSHVQKKLAQWQNIYQPILVADESHNGWRDILVADDNKMYRLKYNAGHYLTDVSKAPEFNNHQQALVAVGLALDSQYYRNGGSNLALNYSQPIFDCQQCFLFSFNRYEESDKNYYLSVNTDDKTVMPYP